MGGGKLSGCGEELCGWSECRLKVREAVARVRRERDGGLVIGEGGRVEDEQA